ncbi:MAG: YlbF family regulator [Bacilli bacterium]|nr:YlbF family regulator [Bacilli bacterium]
MNDEVIKKSIELHEAIKNEHVVAEFLRLKELFENDKELEQLRKEIARTAQNGDKINHERLMQMYDNHPLVSNYYQLKEEVVNLLSDIKGILTL